jgi:hypothetical protein
LREAALIDGASGQNPHKQGWQLDHAGPLNEKRGMPKK